MIQWYAVHTQSRAEGKARLNLENQGFAVYLPEFLKKRRHGRRTDWVRMPLFPRYLFVGMDVARARWRSINSTFGVISLVGDGIRPLAVPDAVIDSIRTREDDSGLVRFDAGPRFRKGDKVRIVEGAFADHEGLFDGSDDKHRVMVLLSLLGREVRVRLADDSLCQPA